jgi:hypothetical protein
VEVEVRKHEENRCWTALREARRSWAEKETEVELRKHDENESDTRGLGFVA